MKKFFDHVFGADTKGFSLVLSIVLVLGGIAAIMTLILSSYGMFHNDMSIAARGAQGFTKALGTLFLLAAVGWGYWNFSEKISFQVSPIAVDLVLLVLLVLALCTNCGWIF